MRIRDGGGVKAAGRRERSLSHVRLGERDRLASRAHEASSTVPRPSVVGSRRSGVSCSPELAHGGSDQSRTPGNKLTNKAATATAASFFADHALEAMNIQGLSHRFPSAPWIRIRSCARHHARHRLDSLPAEHYILHLPAASPATTALRHSTPYPKEENQKKKSSHLCIHCGTPSRSQTPTSRERKKVRNQKATAKDRRFRRSCRSC
jgi:hypothetical protein